MSLHLSLCSLLVLLVCLQQSATAPAQVVSASLADGSFPLRERPQHKRSDDEQSNGMTSNGMTTHSPSETTNGQVEELQQMEQHVVRELFLMDLPEEERLDSDVESNYMLDLYNEVADNDTGILRPRKSGKQPVIFENVRSLPVRAASQVNNDRHWRLTFDSSGLPDVNDRVEYATLAVYSRHCQSGWRNTTAGRALKASGVHKTNISVYASIHKTYAELRLLNKVSQRLKMKGKCWHVFDETHSVQSWQARKKRGLRHFILEEEGYPSLNADDFLHLRGEGDTKNRPVLVIYTGRRVHPPVKSTSRQRRSVQDEFDNGGGPARQEHGDPTRGPEHTACARRKLVIDFTKSGWHKWIISPQSYKAYRCAGTCKFPIHRSIRSTLHARLEASVTYQNELNGIKDPLPGSGVCCVPTAHNSLTLLFHTRSGGTLMHIANKMVADRCGCR